MKEEKMTEAKSEGEREGGREGEREGHITVNEIKIFQTYDHAVHF